MAKQKTKKQSEDIFKLGEKLGIKKENLEFGLKKDKAKMEAMIKKAAEHMGVS